MVCWLSTDDCCHRHGTVIRASTATMHRMRCGALRSTQRNARNAPHPVWTNLEVRLNQAQCNFQRLLTDPLTEAAVGWRVAWPAVVMTTTLSRGKPTELDATGPQRAFTSPISLHLIWPHLIWTECVVIGRSHAELGRFTAVQFIWNC